MLTSDFFNALNSIQDVDSSDYVNIQNVISSLSIVGYNLGYGLYVLDYFQKEIVFVSENVSVWCGISKTEIETNGYEAYLNYVPKNDLAMLVEINNAAFSFFATHLSNKVHTYSLSYDFHLGNFMVNQHFMPILFKKNKVWLAVCLLSLSSKKRVGNIVLNTGTDCYHYSIQQKRWINKSILKLTEKEKLIIRYSIQGYSTQEIADKSYSSYETVKKQKKNLFKKLGTTNMLESLQFLSDNHLL